MNDNMIKKYDEFEESLKNIFDNKEEESIYYLIDGSYKKELDTYINNLRGNKKPKKNFISSPKILNSFEEVMKHLNQNEKIYILERNLIYLINPKCNLKNCKIVSILAGKGKLIIYFGDKNDKNAFLLFKNKNSNKNKLELNRNNIYIINKDTKNKYQFYKNICNQEFDFNQINDKNYNYIFSFNNFNFNNQKIIKYQNDGKKNQLKFSKINSDNINNSSQNRTAIPREIKNKEQSYQAYSSVQKRKSNYENSKSNYHYESSKIVQKVNKYNANPISKKLTHNISDQNKKSSLLSKLKYKEKKKKQIETDIQNLEKRMQSLEKEIKGIKEELKEFGVHYKEISSSNLSGIDSALLNSRGSTNISNAFKEKDSSKQIRNNSMVQRNNASFRKRYSTENEIKNEQNLNNCKIIPKNHEENYTKLQLALAEEKKKKKSNRIPHNISIKKLPNPSTKILEYVKIELPNYINSIIYCLSQIEDLTKYFFDEYKENNNLKLSSEYYNLNNELWLTQNGEQKYWPNDFMTELFKMSKEYWLPYKSNNPNDIHYFIVFILEQLHRELKKNINIKKEVEYDQYDQNNIVKYIDDFKEESSIISKLFFGFKETTEECLNCNKKANLDNKILSYNYEMFNCLVFPLDEIKNEINSNNVTIIDCFNYIQKTQLFTGDKRNYCDKCEQVYDSNFTTKIYEFPEVLILVFVRNKESGNNVKLDFEEKLNINDLKSEVDVNTLIVFQKQIYNLCGVISFSYEEGKIINNYISSCKSPVDNTWYRYTDSEVTPIRDVQNDIIDYETPYVLFYKKDKLKIK